MDLLPPLIVMTIGHSTRPVKEFINLLKAHKVKRLVDVRAVPRSRHNPQFNPTPVIAIGFPPLLTQGLIAGLGAAIAVPRLQCEQMKNTAWHWRPRQIR